MRKMITALMMALCLCALTGCAFSTSADELYCLPKLPAEYESLEGCIDEMLAAGAEYAAPTAGTNLQSVQMLDLDGDGTQEAIAFFRKSTDEKPMKVCIFKERGGNYEQYALIEGTASSLYSVEYSDLNGDGSKELLIGFKSGTGLQVLSVYALSGGTPAPRLTTVYSRYTLFDADGDGQQELMVLYADEEGRAAVDCYDCGENELQRISTMPLSFAAGELRSVVSGKLASGESALFLTGVSEGGIAVMDILILSEEGGHRVLKRVGDAFGEVFWFMELYPEDVNGDGVIEVPDPVVFPTSDLEGEVYYRIDWRQYDVSGKSQTVKRGFRSESDGWSIALKESWDGIITPRRTVSAEESSVTFLLLGEEGERVPFLSIHAITGEAREVRATRSGRFVLARQAETVYAAQFHEGNALIADAMDEQEVRDSFSLLVNDWTAG